MTLDLEAEYDNRARVPGALQILERWQRDAAAFRAAHPPEVIPYGPTERQKIDLFRAQADEGAQIAVFIHGGYWRAHDRSFCSHLAGGLLHRGISVAVVGYDLCPTVTLSAIVEQMRAACLRLSRSGRGLVIVGHSAGGHLAACMLATDWPALDPSLRTPLVSAAYALSGVFDLAPLLSTSINDALRLEPAEAERVSPIGWPAPAGLTLDAVVGSEESSEFRRQSLEMAERWGAEGAATRYEEAAGADHFTIVDPLTDPNSSMTRRIEALARR